MHAHATIDAGKSRPSIQRSKKDGGSFFSGLRVQPKLTVGPVNDVYEQEADAVADKVMRMSDREAVQTHAAPPLVQMKCAHCEEEEKLQKKDDEEQLLQMKSFAGGTVQRACAACDAEEKVQKKSVVLQRTCAACASEEKIQKKAVAPVLIQKQCAACEEEEHVHRKGAAPSNVAISDSVHQTLGSSGMPLDQQTRTFMESRFDYDFSSVQIHDDPTAHRSSRDIHARAYTHGKHIAFSAGEYQPTTPSGKTLLAHELTHVVQQGSGTIKRKEPIIQRDPDPQKVMSRADEIKLSNTSPGEFAVTFSPLTITIFNFGIDKFKLKKEHLKILSEVAMLLKIIPHDKWVITIAGSADSTGTPAINDPLSVNRANSVKEFLKTKSGESFPSIGFGAYLPFESNESLGGRSRNRRADITISPNFKVIPPTCEHPPCLPPCEHPPCDEKHKTLCDIVPNFPLLCDARLPCIDAGWIESLICITLLCLFTPVSALCECVLDPKKCFCLMFPNKCLPKPDKEKKKKACPIHVDLPSGNLPMYNEWPALGLRNPFNMKIVFENNNQGCACECGEYKQEVRGFFEKEAMDGTIERKPHELTPGIFLDRNTFHEDGDGGADSEYGHRSHKSRTGTQLRPRVFDIIDYFSPLKADGCKYTGQDNPGFLPLNLDPTERRRTYFLEFVGGPVTSAACAESGERTYLIPDIHVWRVAGEIIRPPEDDPGLGPKPKGTGPGGPTPKGKVKAIRATPRKTTHKGTQHYRAKYEGGLPADATKASSHELVFSFEVDGSPDPYYYSIKVVVVANDPDSITVVTTNLDSLNLAPEGKPEIILDKQKEIIIPKSYLK